MKTILLMLSILLLAGCGKKEPATSAPGSAPPESTLAESQWDLHQAYVALERLEDRIRAETNPGEREILKLKLEAAVKAYDQAEAHAEATIENYDLGLTTKWSRWRGQLDQAATLIDRARDESARQQAEDAYRELAAMRSRSYK